MINVCMETRYACRSYTAGFLFKQVLSGAAHSAKRSTKGKTRLTCSMFSVLGTDPTATDRTRRRTHTRCPSLRG